jgi:hypothetical protein
MMIRTTERLQQEYPETEITTTAMPDRHDLLHSKSIPEPRIEMISGFPNSVIATGCQKRTQTQARFHTMADHERKWANRAVQLIAGRLVFRAEGSVTWRSGTGDAGRRASRVPSLPMPAIHPLRQPAIPDGGRELPFSETFASTWLCFACVRCERGQYGMKANEMEVFCHEFVRQNLM